MKKLAFFLLLSTFFSLSLYAQAEVPISVENSFGFATFALLVVTTTFVTEALKRVLGKEKHTPNIVIQILSWITGIMLSFFGWNFGMGFLAELLWYEVLLYGIGASLASNGVADTKLIENLIKAIIDGFSKKS